MTRHLLILAFAILLLAVILACGTAGATCYSNIPGCESTVAVAQTAIAAAATAAASR